MCHLVWGFWFGRFGSRVPQACQQDQGGLCCERLGCNQGGCEAKACCMSSRREGCSHLCWVQSLGLELVACRPVMTVLARSGGFQGRLMYSSCICVAEIHVWPA